VANGNAGTSNPNPNGKTQPADSSLAVKFNANVATSTTTRRC